MVGFIAVRTAPPVRYSRRAIISAASSTPIDDRGNGAAGRKVCRRRRDWQTLVEVLVRLPPLFAGDPLGHSADLLLIYSIPMIK